MRGYSKGTLTIGPQMLTIYGPVIVFKGSYFYPFPLLSKRFNL